MHSVLGTFSIREGEWKLIVGRGSGGFSMPKRINPKINEPAGQLYNIKTDPLETKNVYNEHLDIVERLTIHLEQIKKNGKS